jgi:hypothetical protein
VAWICDANVDFLDEASPEFASDLHCGRSRMGFRAAYYVIGGTDKMSA